VYGRRTAITGGESGQKTVMHGRTRSEREQRLKKKQNGVKKLPQKT